VSRINPNPPSYDHVEACTPPSLPMHIAPPRAVYRYTQATNVPTRRWAGLDATRDITIKASSLIDSRDITVKASSLLDSLPSTWNSHGNMLQRTGERKARTTLLSEEDILSMQSPEQELEKKEKKIPVGFTFKASIDPHKESGEIDITQLPSNTIVYNLCISNEHGALTLKGATRLDELLPNLGKDLVIKPKMIVTYPDTTRKPPPGIGLNKEVVVDLFHIDPVDHTGKSVDPGKFGRSLKRNVASVEGTEFLNYSLGDGGWTYSYKANLCL